MNPAQNDCGDVFERAARAAASLAADPRVKLVYLFGSAAHQTDRTPGDIDLAVMTDPSFSFEELIRRRADLVQAAKIPIDLVSLNDAPIVLAHEIVDGGRCLYARDPDIETEFVTRTRARYWDFKPYRDEQWRLTGRRVEERLVGP